MSDRISLSEMEALAAAGRAMGSPGAVKIHALTSALRAVHDVLSDAPLVCDVHDDDDPITCGWKRTVISVRAALAEHIDIEEGTDG